MKLLHPMCVQSTAAALLAACCAAPALAQTREPIPFALLDQDLNESIIDLLAIRADDLTYRDPQGRTQTLALARVGALVPAWWSPRVRPTNSFASSVTFAKPSSTLGMLELVDGQRLGVRLAADPATSPDELLWESSLFGRLAVKLDEVRRIRLITPPVASPASTSPAAADTPPAKNDVVYLANGDRIAGLIERIGPTISIESAGNVIQTSARQVARIELVNPSRSPAGSRIWLTDGSVVDVGAFVPDGAAPGTPASMFRVELLTKAWTTAAREKPVQPTGSISPPTGDAPSEAAGTAKPTPPKPTSGPLHPASPAGSIKFSQLAALAPNVRSLVALASCKVVQQQPLDGRPRVPASLPMRYAWAGAELDLSDSAAPPPPLGASDVLLPGPMQVDWMIPAGATRFAGWLELPRECWTWGHCNVVFSLARSSDPAEPAVELLRTTLSAESPTTEFNIDFARAARAPASPGGPRADLTLRVTLESGERGSIQDQVLIRRALFRCDVAPGT